MRRAVLPPMGKCDGNIEIKIEGATTVSSYSLNRYTFEFSSSSATGTSIESFEYEQCVVLGKNDNPKVIVTSNGIPVDVRGDIEIELTIFNCFDRESTPERMWMKEIGSKMNLYRDDIAKREKGDRERAEKIKMEKEESEKARQKIAEDLYSVGEENTWGEAWNSLKE